MDASSSNNNNNNNNNNSSSDGGCCSKRKDKNPRQRAFCCGESCTCTVNCACTESLCRCEAASVLNSVSPVRRHHSPIRNVARTTTTSPPRARTTSSGCCRTAATANAAPPPTAVAAASASPPTPTPTNATTTTTTPSSPLTLKDKDPLENEQQQQLGEEAESSSEHEKRSSEEREEAPLEADDPATTATKTTATTQRKKAEFWIDGMTCTMCSSAIETAVLALNDDEEESADTDATATDLFTIHSIAISLATDSAIVEWQQQVTNESSNDVVVQQIRQEIEAIGYDVQQVVLLDHRKQQQKHENGRHATANDDTDPEDPLLLHPDDDDNDEAASSSQQQQLQDHSFSSIQDRWQRLEQRQAAKVAGRRRAFLASLLGGLPIFVLTMILPHVLPHRHYRVLNGHFSVHLFGSHHVYQLQVRAVILWALATPVQFYCGWEFYRMSFYSLCQAGGRAGMDVLVALGTTASYGYALYGVWTNDAEATHFFETSAVLLCFVLAGKWMQATAVRRTSQALSQLMELQAKTAVKVTPFKDRQSFHPVKDPYGEVTLPIQEIVAGDIVKVIRGASIPADGKILYGEISVDESMVTGESLPVLKTPGSVVLGGTICVESSCCGSTTTTNVTGATASATATTTAGGDSARLLGGWGSNQETTTIATAATTAANNEDANNTNTNNNNNNNSQQPCDNNDDNDRRDVGAAFVEVTGVGSATALSQIVEMVHEAQTRAVPIQSFADQVSAVFVPAVCAISVTTFLIWYALCCAGIVPAAWYREQEQESPMTFSFMFAIACLVISCPCALGLATPTAVMVGTGVSAKIGVLIKGGEALEQANKVDSLVFDKTGTLTLGKPAVSDFLRLDDQSKEQEDELLWLLGSLERSSEHPLAKAIVNFAEDRFRNRLEIKPFGQPTQFRAMTGRGATGKVGDITVSVGNRSFAEVLGYDVSFVAEECMISLEEDGKTAILVFIDGTVSAILGIADEIKPDAAASIAYLRERLGVDVWMVTGDNVRTASAVSSELGLASERVIAEALPAAKLEQVRKLQAEGKVVAMVGDGCNDSPALAQADVGMSLGTGAEIANEASDVVLVKGHVADVCTALDLSRVIFRRIQWNLLWSLIYNCLGIPVAAGVAYPLIHARLPPTVAAIAMALSSISVVLSSLSLRMYQPPKMEPPPRQGRRQRQQQRRQRPAGSSSSSGGGRRRRPRPPPAEQFDDNHMMTASLLENDHHHHSQHPSETTMEASEATVVTEATEPTDNRTVARMEEGQSLPRGGGSSS